MKNTSYNYRRIFQDLETEQLQREIDLYRETYDQNYDLLIEAHDRKDWERHNEYCQREKALEIRGIKLLHELARRK